MTPSSVIHLNTSATFKQIAESKQSQLIIDAFTESCKALDASLFEPFMEDDNVFEDRSKYLFLADLKALFDLYKSHKAVEIQIEFNDGTCTGCNLGKSARVFSIRGWGRDLFSDQFAYVIEKENGILIDIYRCRLFSKD